MTDVVDMSWVEFKKQSLSAHWLGEYKYCPSEAILGLQVVEKVKPQQLVAGKIIHEQEAQTTLGSLGPLVSVPSPETVKAAMVFSHRALSKALIQKATLANPERSILFLSIVPELSVWGKPDCVDCNDGRHPVIIETKTTARLPRKPWDDALVQIGVYMLGLEALGFDCTYGLLRYKLQQNPSQVKDFRVSLNDNLRQLVIDTTASARQVLAGAIEPSAANWPSKCIQCKNKHRAFYDLCKLRLV